MLKSSEENIRINVENEELVREKWAQIAHNAVKEFLKKGYKGTTTRELAKACGMSEGALYRYIGSKADVLHLICLRASSIREMLETYKTNLGKISATETLCECIKYYFRIEDEGAESVIFYGREIHNFSHEDRRILLRIQIEVVDFFAEILREGMKSGEFEVEEPELLGHDILMRGQDYALRRWYLKKNYSPDEYARLYCNFILKSIKKTG